MEALYRLAGRKMSNSGRTGGDYSIKQIESRT